MCIFRSFHLVGCQIFSESEYFDDEENFQNISYSVPISLMVLKVLILRYDGLMKSYDCDYDVYSLLTNIGSTEIQRNFILADH